MTWPPTIACWKPGIGAGEMLSISTAGSIERRASRVRAAALPGATAGPPDFAAFAASPFAAGAGPRSWAQAERLKRASNSAVSVFMRRLSHTLPGRPPRLRAKATDGSGAGMVPAVQALEVLAGDEGVDLRRRQRAVAEQH